MCVGNLGADLPSGARSEPRMFTFGSMLSHSIGVIDGSFVLADD
jgi:hypothetical protein